MKVEIGTGKRGLHGKRSVACGRQELVRTRFGSFNQYFAEGTRTEYPRYHQVSVLAGDIPESEATYACINYGMPL